VHLLQLSIARKLEGSTHEVSKTEHLEGLLHDDTKTNPVSTNTVYSSVILAAADGASGVFS
jgi:hypothetical protein